MILQVAVSPIPLLYLSDDVLDFGSDIRTISLTIMNLGRGRLDWKIDKQFSWVAASPSEGVLPKGYGVGFAETVSVLVLRDGMAPGPYEAALRIAIETLP